MDTIKNAYYGFVDFCNRVVQWRSVCTVPYVFAVNTAFWAIVYYATVETQMRSLAALAIIIFCNDVLLAPTHDRSIIVQVVLWPIRDFWKTGAVTLCGISIYQLREDNKDEAVWCAFAAIVLLMISPVYKYNQVNRKIVDTFCAFGSLIKQILTYCIVRPILYVYEALKYVFLLRWLPGLNNWLRSSRERIYDALDRLILQRLRAFKNRCVEIFQYWFYFHWVRDLKSFLHVHLGEPLLQRLRIVRDHFVYVFGGYWFYPLMRYCGRLTLDFSYYLMSLANQCAIAIGNSVVWPLVMVAYDQLRAGSVIVYDSVGRPVFKILYQRYKVVEDMAFIYFIGPIVSVIIKCVPESNPFYTEEMEKELDAFIPGPVGSTEDLDEEVNTTDSKDNAEEEGDDLLEELHDEDLDDLDDDLFLRRRLERELSITDSSDEEFLLFPKKDARRRRTTTASNS